MRRDDALGILKIIGGTLIVSPLVFAFFHLETDSNILSLGYSLMLYAVLWAIGIPMFFYLQYGQFTYLPNYDKLSDYEKKTMRELDAYEKYHKQQLYEYGKKMEEQLREYEKRIGIK